MFLVDRPVGSLRHNPVIFDLHPTATEMHGRRRRSTVTNKKNRIIKTHLTIAYSSYAWFIGSILGNGNNLKH